MLKYSVCNMFYASKCTSMQNQYIFCMYHFIFTILLLVGRGVRWVWRQVGAVTYFARANTILAQHLLVVALKSEMIGWFGGTLLLQDLLISKWGEGLRVREIATSIRKFKPSPRPCLFLLLYRRSWWETSFLIIFTLKQHLALNHASKKPGK